MQYISNRNSSEFKNSDVCVVTEYDTQNKDINFAIVKITGRYPEKNRVRNTICKELAYLQSGSGKVVVNDVEYPLTAGDLVLIEANEKMFWEGDMQLHIVCNPAFAIDQHEEVE